METWQINLSLIPSIAVILTSANRMALGLTDEINVRLLSNVEQYAEILPLKIKQLKRLSISILLMYLSLGLLVLNALLVGCEIIPIDAEKTLIFIAIIIFFIAIYFKIQFSWNAYFIRQKQFKKFLSKNIS
ncbi:Hypothetical protein KQS_08410 [Flavobacterium indicum GPTSA100-9 = DSM 17447]|uniref:DUF2721 domain-containing protein n=1 Tax=Flavobacterium indicum (strain DSM 17447 / CIP 109464 / GPTSA100-9) TaxID=1094466 RepID=H8XTN9_FLAIG|nr:hypothetical protein [Flavobacterium indicum]CCG53619.1 Hypothetical protein KQS_08410 [Flavobacterium indicum GPTSA100-9 = DSM 17447]